MRLIDADKLPIYNTIESIEKSKKGTVAIIGSWVSAISIEEAPTVEAIPIDWITKWAEKFYTVIHGKRYYMGDGYDTIWDMLEDWERENQYGKD